MKKGSRQGAREIKKTKREKEKGRKVFKRERVRYLG